MQDENCKMQYEYVCVGVCIQTCCYYGSFLLHGHEQTYPYIRMSILITQHHAKSHLYVYECLAHIHNFKKGGWHKSQGPYRDQSVCLMEKPFS